jgi:hypothetical protein
MRGIVAMARERAKSIPICGVSGKFYTKKEKK